MQVVIEVEDHLYNQIFSDAEIMIYTGRGCGKTLLATLLRSIRVGTPLPKGHGRLGDLDELETYFKNVRKELKPADYKYAVEFFTRDNMLLNAEQFIHLMDAVIPADNEGD